MSIAPRTKDKRRFSREDVCFRCEIAGPDFEPAHALIVNISPMGCMIRCSREAEPDTFVSFTLPHAGRIEGRIVWAIGGRMGVEFAGGNRGRRLSADASRTCTAPATRWAPTDLPHIDGPHPCFLVKCLRRPRGSSRGRKPPLPPSPCRRQAAKATCASWLAARSRVMPSISTRSWPWKRWVHSTHASWTSRLMASSAGRAAASSSAERRPGCRCRWSASARPASCGASRGLFGCKFVEPVDFRSLWRVARPASPRRPGIARAELS